MARSRLLIYSLLVFFIMIFVLPVQAQAGIQSINNEVSLSFPENALFSAEFQAEKNITSVVLEYGVDQLTCGTVVAEAFPQFTSARDVQVQWTWEMRESGSLPPGALIWWRWQVEDADGTQFTTPTQSITWLDAIHGWQVISGGQINLHYYEGGQAFGQALHDAAAQALIRLSQEVGLQSEKAIDIYIYANTNDLKDAILYEPAWIGGQAFPENNIVIIGVSTDQLDWGKSTEAHELTHVLVGHLTFSCLGSIPTWLNEGLAMVGEGGLQSAQSAQFEQAKSSNQLLSLRSLVGNFSEESDRATLSYSESYSVVNFLIQTYGHDKMTALLDDLRDGATADEALYSVYGFNTDGLEDTWRTSINAAPRVGVANPTPVFTATQVPTIVPVGAAPTAPPVSNPLPGQVQGQSTRQVISPTPRSEITPTPMLGPFGISHGLMVGLGYGLLCCVLVGLLVVVLVVAAALRHSWRK
jgi:hypothetical protein